MHFINIYSGYREKICLHSYCVRVFYLNAIRYLGISINLKWHIVLKVIDKTKLDIAEIQRDYLELGLDPGFLVHGLLSID